MRDRGRDRGKASTTISHRARSAKTRVGESRAACDRAAASLSMPRLSCLAMSACTSFAPRSSAACSVGGVQLVAGGHW